MASKHSYSVVFLPSDPFSARTDFFLWEGLSSLPCPHSCPPGWSQPHSISVVSHRAYFQKLQICVYGPNSLPSSVAMHPSEQTVSHLTSSPTHLRGISNLRSSSPFLASHSTLSYVQPSSSQVKASCCSSQLRSKLSSVLSVITHAVSNPYWLSFKILPGSILPF